MKWKTTHVHKCRILRWRRTTFWKLWCLVTAQSERQALYRTTSEKTYLRFTNQPSEQTSIARDLKSWRMENSKAWPSKFGIQLVKKGFSRLEELFTEGLKHAYLSMISPTTNHLKTWMFGNKNFCWKQCPRIQHKFHSLFSGIKLTWLMKNKYHRIKWQNGWKQTRK